MGITDTYKIRDVTHRLISYIERSIIILLNFVDRRANIMTLKEEVIHLVTLEQEGGYWDFKKQWHDNKTSLLHDVI